MMTVGARGLVAALALLLAGCATRPSNAPLAQYDHGYGYRVSNWQAERGDPEFGLVVAMSGGGTRAAAFSYGILEELRRKNPRDPEKGRRKHLHYRFLTEDIGDPHLQKQIIAVTTLLSVSDNWPEFTNLFCRKFPPGPNDLFALPPPEEDADNA